MICASSELRNALTRIDEVLASSVRNNQPCRIAVFSDDDERLIIGAAIVERTKELGLPASLTRSDFCRWVVRVTRDQEVQPLETHVLAGLPPKEKAQQAFAAVSSNLIFLLPLALAGAALLPDPIEEFILAPFGQRPLDKAAQLISSAVEVLDTPQEIESATDATIILPSTPALALLAICLDVTKFSNVVTARDAGNRLASQLPTNSALRPGEPMTATDLNRALFPQPQSLPPNIRRLWVEGDTDVSLFKLAARLIHATYPDEPHRRTGGVAFDHNRGGSSRFLTSRNDAGHGASLMAALELRLCLMGEVRQIAFLRPAHCLIGVAVSTTGPGLVFRDYLGLLRPFWDSPHLLKNR